LRRRGGIMDKKFSSGNYGKSLPGRGLLVFIGSVIYASAVRCFFIPANLMSGGVTGVSLILNRLFSLPVGIMMIIFNIPLFIFGFRKMGRDFFILSMAGAAVSSLAIDILGVILPDIPELYGDRLLASVLGGAISGIGLGITIAAGGSTGGSDIITLLFNRRLESLSLGRAVLILDLLIILTGTIIFRDISAGLYTVVAIYVVSVSIDSVLYGANIASVVFIVTKKPEPLTLALTNELNRGLTILNGRGGYTGSTQNVLICAIGRRQLSHLKRIIRLNDPDAFVIVSDAKEVMGLGFKNLGA
jgi:uncharacterized membrane-anchored protein YitT (DUF2179 family)